MIDKKVYKTDYQSEFTEFFNDLSTKDEPKSEAMIAEQKKYSEINKLRDNVQKTPTRNKLWKGF